MPNRIDSQIVSDGWRNAVVKVTGVLDTSDVNLSPAIQLDDFTNNDVQAGTLVGLRVDHVWHSIGDGLEISITWNGLVPQIIMAVAGRGRESFSMVGGLSPDQARTGYDGNINISTSGYGTIGTSTVQNFTVLLEMIKLYR